MHEVTMLDKTRLLEASRCLWTSAMLY